MKNVTIRTATPGDIPGMARLWREKQAVQMDRRFAVPPDGPARWSQVVAVWLDDTSYMIVVAERDGEVVGYVIGRITAGPPGLVPERVGVVNDLAIGLHSSLNGLGRRLLDSMRVWFTEQEISVMLAEVPRLTPVEQAFWRALGATEWIDVMWMQL